MRTYRWFPLYGPGEEDEGKAPIEVDSEEDFIGERERERERGDMFETEAMRKAGNK